MSSDPPRTLFLSIDNFEMVKSILTAYMRDRYGYSVQARMDKSTLNKMLYKIMRDVYESDAYQTWPLKDLNNLTLNVIRDRLVNKYALQALPQKVSVKVLDREQQLYGTQRRPIVAATADDLRRPVSEKEIAGDGGAIGDALSSSPNAAVDQQFERLLQARDEERAAATTPPETARTTLQAETNQKSSDAYSMEEFTARLTDLESMREERLQTTADLRAATAATAVAGTGSGEGGGMVDINGDPSMLYRTLQNEAEVASGAAKVGGSTTRGDGGGDAAATTAPMHGSIIPRDKLMDVTRYLAINGFDRNVQRDALRYRFTIESMSQQRYRNITKLQFTKLILPMEIVEPPRTLTTHLRSYFQHDYKLSYPYLLLSVAELQTTYDGTNDALRQSSTLFVYENSYTAENGRGYLILCPAQNDHHAYSPATPLASLPPRLTFSILKPNGTLLNQSRDQSRVFKLEYTLLNKNNLKIVLSKFFDKNEFYKGDTVLLRDCHLEIPAGSTVSSSAYAKLNAFLNRHEGHDIVELGQPNANGYYDNFITLAPGTVNEDTGERVVDADIVAAIHDYNTAHADAFCKHDASTMSTGAVINMSLQAVITARFTMTVSDPSALDMQVI
jgi:hypothetical protein